MSPLDMRNLQEVSNTNYKTEHVAQRICPQEKREQDLTPAVKCILSSLFRQAALFALNSHISCDARISECYR